MIRHYTPEDIAAARAEYPQHFIVEIETPGAACLIAIADTPRNRGLVIPLMPGMNADLLDGNTIVSGGPL